MKAHFRLHVCVNAYNCRIRYVVTNPLKITEQGLHVLKVKIWLGFSTNFIIGPYFVVVEEVKHGAREIAGQRYLYMLRNNVIPQLQGHGLENITFMHD